MTKIIKGIEKPKLLAPAGDMIALRAALASGADEIYFGIKGINMRAGAKNFELKDLSKIAKACHTNKDNTSKLHFVKAYIALNTIIYEKEKKYMQKILKKVKQAKIDAVICWDMSIIQECIKLKIPVHLSTQASVSNYAALEFYVKMIPTLERVVLARECTAEDIKNMTKLIKKNKLNIELETFIHGAMCISVSGRCFMSQELFGKSANRGECLQPCRRNYEVRETKQEITIHDPEEKHDLILGSDYVMSPKDLCTLPFIEQLIELGITSFKIEGRNRSPEYVQTVVSCYREAIDHYFSNRKKILKNKKDLEQFNLLKKDLFEKLKTVYHRGFSTGFYHGKPIDGWCQSYGSLATQIKELVGKVTNYYPKAGVAEIKIESHTFTVRDTLLILGQTTGVVEVVVNEIRTDSAIITHEDTDNQIVGKSNKTTNMLIKQGDIVSIKVPRLVRKNDAVYVIVKK